MLQLTTQNEILIDGKPTRLHLAQRSSGTVVYTPENATNGAAYVEHPMPHRRYSASHQAPASGVAGVADLERDIRALILRLVG